MSQQEMMAEIARLQAANDSMKTYLNKALTMKVSDKGGVQINGLGRFPTTLYPDQMLRLLDAADQIRAFITTNQSKFSVKK